MDGNEVRSFAATFVTDTTNPPAPRPRWLRRGRFDLVEIADVITALICFAIANSTLTNENANHHGHHAPGLLVLLAFVTCAPLALRTRFPLAAWAASTLAIIGTSLVIPLAARPDTCRSPLLVYGLCLYAVTVRCRPRIVVAAAAVTVAGAAFLDPGSVPAAVFLAVSPLLLGAVVRQRRSGERQLEEQERRHSGERALLEERQRIARELHDVVAHHMSVIAIQAEAAPYKTADPPPELVESFGDIRASALAGLSELRRVLGVLRTGGQDTAPQPGLAELDALLDSARSGGVSVTVTRSGNPVPLPEGVDLSAYRIVQEALSNAMRHAPGSHVRAAPGLPSRRPGPRDMQRRRPAGRPGPGGQRGPRRRGRRRPRPGRHAGAHHDAGREPGRGPDRRRRVPGGRGPAGEPPRGGGVTIRVLVADDQGMVRSGFSILLNAQPDIEVVGEAVNGQEAVTRAAELRPDVILMDVRMPVLDGLQATRQIAAADGAPKVLVLTTFDLDDYVYEALRSGASGFLLKDASAGELAEAVRVVAAGDALLAPGVTRRLIAEFARLGAPRAASRKHLDGLTDRETEVLGLVARGMSNGEIAAHLVVAEQTVKTHVSRVLMKLALRDRAQAVVFAYECGLIRPGE